MPEDEVSTQSPCGEERAFEIDGRAGLEISEIRLSERLGR